MPKTKVKKEKKYERHVSTVGEWIEYLSEYPENLPVYLFDGYTDPLDKKGNPIGMILLGDYISEDGKFVCIDVQ